jgi:hypothetical protein
MLYEVTFLRTFPLGQEEVTFRSYLGEDEFDYEDDEFGINPEALAVELAMYKFLKDYTLKQGAKLETISVKRIV